jgi:hypothetical protein
MQEILETPGLTVAGNLEHGRVKVVPGYRTGPSGYIGSRAGFDNPMLKSTLSPSSRECELGYLVR